MIGSLQSLTDILKNDIYNCDETGLFYRTLPDRTLATKGKACKGGKLSKERITVMLCCSAGGDKLQPFVIGKAQKPRCFKNIDVKKLPVVWKANRRAWMTNELFIAWVTDLNKTMKRQNRKNPAVPG